MTTSLIEDLDYAALLAGRTPHEIGQWAQAIDRVGGADRARQLLEQTGEPVWLWSPLLLDITAVADPSP
jgi:hypothetical protein